MRQWERDAREKRMQKERIKDKKQIKTDAEIDSQIVYLDQAGRVKKVERKK